MFPARLLPTALLLALVMPAFAEDEPVKFPSRDLLTDPAPAVRLRAALAFAEHQDAEAIPVLIDVLAELPADERKPAEAFLRDLAGPWAPDLPAGDDEASRRKLRDVWREWWEKAAGPAALAEIRNRTLTPEGRVVVQSLIRDLGAGDFRTREQAGEKLVARGELAIPFLEEASKSTDLEAARRARECLRRIARASTTPVLKAARLIALRKPAGSAGVLLAYLPHARDPALADEVRQALRTVAFVDGKPDPALVAALGDELPDRRSEAGRALAEGEGAVRLAVRKLLEDPDRTVRLRVAVALALARDKEAVPTLIRLLGELPPEQAWEAQDFLVRLAGTDAPDVNLGDDAMSRARCRDAWAAWWAENKGKADLARLTEEGAYLGYTVLCLKAAGGKDQVVEVDRAGNVRWRIEGPHYPVDAWVLPGNRVLIAEWSGRKVTERDLTGKVLWEKEVGTVYNVQPLPGGRTFIAAQGRLLIVDRTGKEVGGFNWPTGNVWAGYRDKTGEIVFFAGNECIRADAKGKVQERFRISPSGNWTSGIDLLPRGGVLVTEHNQSKVAEYSRTGKRLWEVNAPQVTTATRLRNGHILAASYQNRQVTELDRTGKVVWEYKSPHHVFRARRR